MQRQSVFPAGVAERLHFAWQIGARHNTYQIARASPFRATPKIARSQPRLFSRILIAGASTCLTGPLRLRITDYRIVRLELQPGTSDHEQYYAVRDPF